MEKHIDSIFNFNFDHSVVLIKNATREEKEIFLDNFYSSGNIAIGKDKRKNVVELIQDKIREQIKNSLVEIEIIFTIKYEKNYEC